MSFAKTLLKTGLATSAAATVGSLATEPDTRWYKSLKKPSWQPPTWLFPVAWTALYVSIAASSAKVLTELEETEEIGDKEQALEARTRRSKFKRALGFNLVLNTGWSVLFWQGRNNEVSTVEAAALAGSSIDLARRAAKTSGGAGLALVLYALWTSFATALTWAIAKRNR